MTGTDCDLEALLPQKHRQLPPPEFLVVRPVLRLNKTTDVPDF